MEAKQWYFDLDVNSDDEYIHINDHLLKLDDVAQDVEQLIEELYDDCEKVDRDIVHDLLVDICNKLEMPKPKKENLKL